MVTWLVQWSFVWKVDGFGSGHYLHDVFLDWNIYSTVLLTTKEYKCILYWQNAIETGDTQTVPFGSLSDHYEFANGGVDPSWIDSSVN